MAKNAVQSRRFGGSLELFAASEWHFTQKDTTELLLLDQALIKRSYEGIRKDFERLSLASLFNELMLKLAPQSEPAPDLFRMHSNALAVLEDSTGTGIEVSLLNAYLARLLQWSGSQPQIELCLQCQKPLDALEPHQAISCVVDDAGWVCSDCRTIETRHIRRDNSNMKFEHSMLRVTPAALKDFQLSLTVPIRRISDSSQASRQEHLQLFKFLEALAVYHLPGLDRHSLKSLRFLDLESTALLKAASPQ
jgi:DNA repair protein RecO